MVTSPFLYHFYRFLRQTEERCVFFPVVSDAETDGGKSSFVSLELIPQGIAE
jgi:hypothetical protein